jgi:hypothetical protein
MGCSAASRLTKELKQTQDELTSFKLVLKNSSALRQSIDGELTKINNTASILTNDNEKLKQDLAIRTGATGMNSSAQEDTGQDEQERFREWIEFEIREGNTVLSTLVKLHGADETGQVSKELKRQMDGLEEKEYAIEKLKEFSQWKYKLIRAEVDGLMDDRVAWMQFVQGIEDEIKDTIEQVEGESGGRMRPVLTEIRSQLGQLPSISQSLPRFRALKDLAKSLLALQISGSGDSGIKAKSQIAKQADEIKAITQRLAALRKVEDERRAASEKELSLKEVHIKHLENKVKDLSRPSVADGEMKARDRDIERVKTEIAKAKEEQRLSEEQLEAAQHRNTELAEKHEALEQELTALRG